MQPEDEIVLNTVKNCGYTHTLAFLILQQAKVESANFTSHVFRENRNAFGYKFYKGALLQIAPSTVSPEKDFYAKYRSLEDSVREIIFWLRRRDRERKLIISDLTSEIKYATALKSCGFFGGTAEAYAKAMKVY